MQGFEQVTLGWRGEEYTVQPERQLMLVAKIEDALSGSSGQQAVDVLLRSGGPSVSRLASAYGAALRHAGATVSDDEIYLSIMEDFAEQDADSAVKIQGAIFGLLAIVAPPIARKLAEPEPEKKPKRRPAKKG